MISKKEYRFKDNPEEERFFNEIVNQYGYTEDTLIRHISYVVHGVSSQMGNPPNKYATDDEVDTFLATIQWLGSPVGQGFLNRMGYEKTNK